MRILFLAAALALAPAALAQDAAPAGPDGLGSVVTFSLRTVVPTDASPVPEVVLALSEDPHLVRLDVSGGNPIREEVKAEFVFDNMADYATWRGSDRVVALLAELGADSQGAGMSTALNLRRHPLAARASDGG